MSALTVTNDTPREIEVATQALLDRYEDLTHRAAAAKITTEDEKLQAEAWARQVRELGKEITATRKQGTAALDAIIAAAIARERQLTGVLDVLWTDLTGRVQKFIDEENARRAEQARLAREEADRLRKEQEAAQATARAVEAERLRLETEASTPPGEEPAPPPPVAPAAPIYIPERYVPPPMKAQATRKTTSYGLEFIDRKKVPAYSASGHELRDINETALKAFLKGLPKGEQEIAGAVRLVEITGVGAR